MSFYCGIRCRACMQAHDYRRLVAGWRTLARRSGFRMRAIARTGGYTVYGITTASPSAPAGGYVSAGIHGDEPAGVWALLRWAGKHRRRLASREWVLLPCLNPWGLVANSRHDARGRDLNRSFHLRHLPLVRGWRAFVGRRRFAPPAVILHEDYDGDGIYAYSIGGDPAVARRGIAAAGRVIGPSLNPSVDRKWRQDGGLVRLPHGLKPIRGVEAREVLAGHATSVTSLETPSETALELRVQAHAAYLDAVFATSHL